MDSLDAEPRKHTFVFVGFTGEEKGLVGSEFYAKKLSEEQRSKIEAVINFDTLGLSSTKVWASHADKHLVDALYLVAETMKLSLAIVNVDNLGSSDSESFAKYKIPRITIHSLTQETLPVLHSDKDTLSAIKIDDYYASYRLCAAYLAFLDNDLGQKPSLYDKPAH